MKSNNKICKSIAYSMLLCIFLGLFLQRTVSNNSNLFAEKMENKPSGKSSIHFGNRGKGNTLRPSKKHLILAPRVNATYQAFLAMRTSGIIGNYKGRESDDPSDNIFIVKIDKNLSIKDKISLSFTLSGVEDKSSVSYSINDLPAVGGYLVKKSEVSTKQKLELNPLSLRKGENRIQFSTPEGLPYGYKIENLCIEVEKADDLPFAINPP